MIGPVLHQEMLLGSRRNKLHILRWIYAGWLVVVVLYFYMSFLAEEQSRRFTRFTSGGMRELNVASAPEVVGGRFAESFVWQQFFLIALLTPPFVAGAVTDEKRRGTLQHLMLTDLESRHIILGKLLGRVALVSLVLLAGLPLFGLLAGFGGINPVSILFAGLVLLLPLFGLASLTLLASVWCRQTREAVLGVYVVGIAAGLLVYFLGGPLRYLDPLFVLEPAWGPASSRDTNEALTRLGFAALSWGAVAFPCLILAIWLLRPVYVREVENVRRTGITWQSVERAPVDEEPVRWRERNIEGLAPNPTLRRVPTWLGITLVSLGTILSSLAILYASLAPGVTLNDLLRLLLLLNLRKAAELLPDAGVGFLLQSVVAMLLGSLVVGIRTSGAVTVEREKQTWEALLLTPISAKQIVRGKLWGILGASLWYLLAYAAPALALSALGGPLAFFWTVLGLAVTVLSMYFIGATGIYCSVTSKSSWRALLATLAVGYLGGLMIYLVTTPVIWILSLLILLAVWLLDQVLNTNMAGLCMRNFGTYLSLFYVASCIGLAAIFYLMARLFVQRAYRYIADRERTRHWYDEPVYRRSRQPRDLPRLTTEEV